MKTKEPILRIPASVKEDVSGYREAVAKFLIGKTEAESFKAYRVPMGVYEQRTSGKYMVRIRIGAGLVLPYQLERIAELSKKYGNGVVHVTTRQDIQIHDVDIKDTPDIFESLLEVELSTRGGGGNTVRNVTACVRCGVCPKEQFDVAPYAIGVAEYLLQDRGSFNLPRKYKIVFSGCPEDCAFASVADLGFFAHVKEGRKGFSVYAAGGLGSSSAVAVMIEEFVEAEEVFEVAEAIKRLFDEYGDRSNRYKARLRYVLKRFGADEFIRLYRKYREAIKAEGLVGEVPEIREIERKVDGQEEQGGSSKTADLPNVMAEKISGHYSVRLRLKNGDISAEALVRVGQISEGFGDGIVRTSQLQDIFITGVSKENIRNVNRLLKELGIDTADGGPKVVSCTGATTCKLGLCFSRDLADAISDELEKINGLRDDEVIRISGCPNSCGQHNIAQIGFQGRIKRVNGELVPYYDILLGGRTIEGEAKLGEKAGMVAAEELPDLLAAAFKSNDAVERYLSAKISE